MVTITPLDAALGASVEGVDLAAAPSDELMRELTAALYAHRVIIIKRQKLDQESYLHFGRQWGEPIPHVADHMRLPGFPELMGVGNTEEKDRADAVRPRRRTLAYRSALRGGAGERHHALCDRRAEGRRRDRVRRHRGRLRGPRQRHQRSGSTATSCPIFMVPANNATTNTSRAR